MSELNSYRQLELIWRFSHFLLSRAFFHFSKVFVIFDFWDNFEGCQHVQNDFYACNWIEFGFDDILAIFVRRVIWSFYILMSNFVNYDARKR